MGIKEKIVLEYSAEQKCHHIQLLSERNSKPENGYKLIGVFDDIQGLYKVLDQRKEILWLLTNPKTGYIL